MAFSCLHVSESMKCKHTQQGKTNMVLLENFLPPDVPSNNFLTGKNKEENML